MIELHVDIDTPDGRMNTFVTHPEERGPHPVVLFYMDAPGKREELHDMARRIGTVGYYVVLPNLYYRSAGEFDASKDFAGSGSRMRELMDSLDFDKVATDTTAMLAYVDADSAAGPDVGAVGYCMSGPFAYAMAGLFPERIRAAASIYGVRLHGERSPQALAPNVKGELYFGCAELDEYAPAEMVDDLERYVEELGLNARVERYAGAHHGFAFPSRTGAYDKASCERHYERLFDLFDRNLRQRNHGG
jgi:carboxymethylenebutenolidase